MAKGYYVPVNGLSKKAKKWYVPVNGLSKAVSKAYCPVSGLSKQFWPVNDSTPFYVIQAGQFNYSNPNNTEFCINRYPDNFANVIDAGDDPTDLSDTIGIFGAYTYGNKKLYKKQGYAALWVHSNTTNKWAYNAVDTPANIRKTVSQSDEINALFIPINRVYASSLTVIIKAKGTGNLKIGCHNVNSSGALADLGFGQITLGADYQEQTISISCNSYIDYISIDAEQMNDTVGAIKAISYLKIKDFTFNHCIYTDYSNLDLYYVSCPLPVKKNSISITYNGSTTTVSKTSGDSDVYFCYYYRLEEYNSAANPFYSVMILIFAVSESAFVTDGTLHPTGDTAYTSHDCTYYISDVHKIAANIGSTPWPTLPPICDIPPISYNSAVESSQKESIGEAFVLGDIYDNN